MTCAAETGNCNVWQMLSSAPGVWHQVLHSVPHSGHAQRSVRSHEKGKVPDARDDVRSRAGASTEGEEEERTALSPRVALVPPPPPQPLHITPRGPKLTCLFMCFSFESLAWLGWFHTPKNPLQWPDARSKLMSRVTASSPSAPVLACSPLLALPHLASSPGFPFVLWLP